MRPLGFGAGSTPLGPWGEEVSKTFGLQRIFLFVLDAGCCIMLAKVAKQSRLLRATDDICVREAR